MLLSIFFGGAHWFTGIWVVGMLRAHMSEHIRLVFKLETAHWTRKRPAMHTRVNVTP